MAGSRKDQYDITVTVAGKNLGTWDKLTGGDIDSDEMTYKPGGMGNRISLGGSVNVANVVVSVIYDLQRIHAIIHWLMPLVGKATVVVKKQPLDVNGNVSGMRPITYTGKLKRVTPPEVDSEAVDAALLELEMTPVGTVA